MTELLHVDLDYILFVYALGMACLAAMLIGLADTVSSPLPWRWFGASAALLAGSATADLLRVSLGGHIAIDVVRVLCFFVGCVLLLEFARRAWAVTGDRRVGPWVVIALAALTALGLLSGYRAVYATSGYLLGAVGGLWAAAALWRFARHGSRHGRPLIVAGVCMVGFVVAEFLVTPEASIPPAAWVDQAWFFDTFGFPVHLLGIAFAIPFVGALWYYYRTLLSEEHPGLVDRRGLILEVTVAVLVAVVLIGGFWATTVVGRHADADARDSLIGRANLAAAGLNPEDVGNQTGTPADAGTPDYKRLREQLMLMTAASDDIRWFYLMALKGDATVFTVDGIPVYDPGHAEPGTVYEEAPAGLTGVFRGGSTIAVGPYSDEYGTFVSAFAAIREPYSGRVFGVLGIDVNASLWAAAVAEQRVAPILVTLLLALIVIGWFVTQERMRLAALTIGESEREYRTVLETMQDGFYRVDDQGDLLMVSPSFARIFGYANAEEVQGLNLARDFYEDPEDRAVLLKALAAGDGAITDYEMALKRKDGSAISVSASSHYYRDAIWVKRGVEGVLRDVTERKRSEKALAESEERARLLLQSAGDGIFGVDREGHVTFMNSAAEEMLGWAAAELQDIGMHDAIHYARADGSPYPISECPQLAAYTEGVECRVDDEVLWRKDGTAFPVEYIARPLRKDDAVTGAIITFRDIGERLEAERALRESRDRLDFVLRSAAVGVWDWDIDPDVAHWDDTIVDLYGLPPGVLEGRWSAFDACIHPDDLDAVEAAAALAIETDVPYEAEFRVIHQDGTVAYLAERGRVRRDDAGAAVRLSGVTWDITERRLTEEELQFTQHIVEEAADVVFWMTAGGAFVYANRTARELLGYSLEEFRAMTIHEVDPDFLMERWPEHIAELEQAGSLTFETRHCRKDGVAIPMEVTAMYVEFGGEAYDVAFARDISERRAAEVALRKAKEQTDAANRNLEHAITRANHLALEAEGANLAKSEFLANMSHEIRTPMNGVIGMTTLLLDTGLDSEQRDYAHTVQASAEALLVIINDILDFSKIEAGKLEIETLDFDLRTAVEDTCDLPALNAQQKGLELTLLVEAGVPAALRGDPGRLRQVLTNLIGNAIKFTDDGEVAISVALVSETDAAAMLRFAVRDTGIGILAEKLDALFEAFTQADASTTRRFGGTGLGLTISRRLVELMGGEIAVESEPGAGSTFSFTATFAKQDRAALAAVDEDFQPVDVTGIRILAVDDNATNRRVVAGMLDAWGCRHTEVDGAEPAFEALRAAQAERDPYPVVILDMMMPDVDGETLGAAIKSDAALVDSSLIMMTSMGSRGDATRLEGLGFAAYLTKPVKQSQLFDCLMVVLNRGAAANGAAATPRIITRHALAEREKRHVRILLAEDNPINQKVALKTLEKMGHRADAVANGVEALAALEERPYDLVFMDVQMPEMDGMEATRRIRDPRSSVRDHAVPIVALTAHAMKEDREACLAAGMDDYLSKPLQADKLAAVLRRWTGRELAGELSVGRTRTSAGQEPLVEAAPVESAAVEAVVFDKSVLLGVLEGDREAVDEIMAEYLVDAPKQVAALREALAGGDPDVARRQAHSLKGASANVGAEALRAAAYEVEKAAAAGDLATAAELTSPVEDELQRLQKHLAGADEVR